MRRNTSGLRNAGTVGLIRLRLSRTLGSRAARLAAHPLETHKKEKSPAAGLGMAGALCAETNTQMIAVRRGSYH